MNVRISQLPSAPSAITGAELVPIVQNGQTVQTTVSAITNSPSLTQTFLTVTNQPTLPNSRYFAVGTGLGLTDGGAQSSLQLTLNGTSGSLEVVGTGIIVKTAANTVAARTIGVGSGLSISNADGVSGNPAISVTGLLAALVATSGTGLLGVVGGTSITNITIAGTANQVSVANGDTAPVIGLASNPIIPGTAGMVLPIGTSAQRAVSPTNGTARYNSDTSRFEFYQAGAWANIGTGDGTVTLVSGTGGEIDVVNGSTTPVISIADDANLPGTGAVNIPKGGTAQRPVSPANGDLRYNTDTATFEGYANSTWGAIVAGSGVTSVGTGTGLLGGPITSTGTISIDDTVVATLTGTQTLTNKTMSGASNTFSNIGNSALTNSSITIGSTSVSLGGTISTFAGVSISGSTNTLSNIGNSSLVNSSITINGSSVSLGGSVTVTATATNALTIGTGLSGTSYNGSSAVTIAISNTGVSASTYGSASAVPVFAVNAQGQITSVTNTNISIASSAITDKGLANGVASLDGSGTVPTSQLPAAVLGALKYQGTWNASTNTPTLTSSVGTQGYYYVVDVAGSTNLNGITDWKVGDWAIFNGSIWEKIDNTDAVTSVNGYTGTVVLSYSDVGAPSTSGTNATGTWGISISGNAATATSATTATTATNANSVAVTTGSASTNYLSFVTATTGNLPVLTNSGLTYNSSTNAITGGITGGTF